MSIWSKTAVVLALTSMYMVNSFAAAPVSTITYVTYDKNELQSLRQQGSFGVLHEDAGKLRRAAEHSLTQEALSVTQKKAVPPSGDRHDYYSLAKYYWPDPQKPNGLPYIGHDGRVNPECNNRERYDADRRGEMTGAVNKLSLGYFLTGKEEYAKKAAELLRVWFINPETRMNPNLNLGQSVPGVANGKPSGIIETVGFINLVDSLRLIENSPSFTKEDQAAMKKWFADYLDWLLTSDLGTKEGKASNNHGVWYDAQVATYANYVGKDDLAKQVIKEAKEKRILKQIEPNGSMPRELARTKSMSYTTYNLRAFITLARVGDRVGVNIWDYKTADGRSIRKALDYFMPYLLGKKKWEHEQIINYHEPDFAKYLYFAKMHYNTTEYDQAIEQLLTNK